jgi:hypothetical protein
MARRAEALAERIEQGARALAAYASRLSEEQWRTAVPPDGRTVGVMIHHVASVYPIEVQLAQVLAGGKPIENVTMNDIKQMNAGHARDHAGADRATTIELLQKNSAAAAAEIRKLSDEELDRAAPVSLNGDAPLTCQFFIEDHALRHSFHHLARIRAFLEKAG